MNKNASSCSTRIDTMQSQLREAELKEFVEMMKQ
jgi:hypothetical protein